MCLKITGTFFGNIVVLPPPHPAMIQPKTENKSNKTNKKKQKQEPNTFDYKMSTYMCCPPTGGHIVPHQVRYAQLRWDLVFKASLPQLRQHILRNKFHIHFPLRSPNLVWFLVKVQN